MSYLTVTLGIVLATAVVYGLMAFVESRRRRSDEDRLYVKPAPQAKHVRVKRGAKDKERV